MQTIVCRGQPRASPKVPTVVRRRDSIPIVFGSVLREFREASKLSQERLAELSGLHRTYVSLLERGLRNPSLTVIHALARALGTSMVAMVGRVQARLK